MVKTRTQEDDLLILEALFQLHGMQVHTDFTENISRSVYNIFLRQTRFSYRQKFDSIPIFDDGRYYFFKDKPSIEAAGDTASLSASLGTVRFAAFVRLLNTVNIILLSVRK